MFKINKLIKFVFSEFIYGGHLQSLGSVAIVTVSSILFNLNLSWDLLILVYLISYVAYLFNRFKEINIDSLTNIKRSEHLRGYYKKIPWLIFLVLISFFLISFFYSNFSGFIFNLVILLFGLLYSVYFKKLTKKIPLFKNFYVAFAFSILVYLNFFYYGVDFNVLNPIIFALAIFVFIKGFLMQVFLDIKDVISDKKEGLLTLSSIFGKKNVLLFLLFFESFINFVFPFFLYFLGSLPILVLSLFLLFFYDLYCFYLSWKNKYFAYLLKGGEFIIWPILMFLFIFFI